MERSDVEQALEIIRRAHSGDPVFSARAQRLETKLGSSWVVENGDGVVVAVATASRSRFHPHEFLTFDTLHPQRADLLGLVLEACRPEPSRHFFSRLRPHDAAGIDAYRRSGFRPVERAYQCTVDLSVSRYRQWADAVAARSAGDGPVIELDAGLLDDAAALLADWYRRVHTWSPPERISAEEAKAVFLGNVLPQSIGILDDNCQLIAVGVVAADPFLVDSGVGHVEFVVCDVSEDDWLLVQKTYAALFLRSLDSLDSIRLTATDIYPASIRAASSTPFRFEPELVIVAEPYGGG